jgi:hypothetical protein
MSLLGCALGITLCLTALASSRHATREKALLERIAVLARENKGLEAQVTREALHAYCRVECGSCIPIDSVVEALTGPTLWDMNGD